MQNLQRRRTEIRRPNSLACVALIFISLCLFCCTEQSKIDSLFKKAESAKIRGAHQEAIDAYKKIISIDSLSASARMAYLESGDVYYYGMKNLPAALMVYKNLVENAPTNSKEVFQAQKRLAEIYRLHTQDYRKALPLYQALVNHPAADPKEIPDLQMLLADAYFSADEFEQARLEYSKFMDDYTHHPKAERAAFQVAETYYMENQCLLAIKAYEQMLDAFPKSEFAVRARFGIANCQEEQGQLKEALKSYEALQTDYPNKNVITIKIKNLNNRIRQTPG